MVIVVMMMRMTEMTAIFQISEKLRPILVLFFLRSCRDDDKGSLISVWARRKVMIHTFYNGGRRGSDDTVSL